MPHDDILLTVDEVAQLLGKSSRTIQWMIGTGRLHASKINKRGGLAYRIPLGELPEEYQALYLAQLDKQRQQERGEVAATTAAETPAKSTDAPQPVTDEQNRLNWEWFDQQPSGVQARAKAANIAVQRYCELRKLGAPKGEAERVVRDELGVAPRTLRAWRKKIHPDQPHTWVPLLADRPRGKREPAEFTPEAWESIKNSYLSLSQPDLTDIVRRHIQMAQENNWIIPDYRVVLARINALPHWLKVARREGDKALTAMYPTLKRDYTTLRLHELWCADGHKADIWCRWPDGEVCRPVVMAWIDVRTRVFLGYRIGKTETADLVRLSFKAAVENTGAIPEAVLIDNGRGFASKLLTGGAPNRFRFKVKGEDIPGILTTMGVTIHWAMPGRGQSKPIESHWRVIVATSKRKEFEGAYCGSSPTDRPEECDPAKAVPIAAFDAAVDEDLEYYNSHRQLRGHGMNNRAPREVYEELTATTPVRVPTAEQLRTCFFAAEKRRLNREMSFELEGNSYWTEQCQSLDPRRAYVVRFDPEDLHQDIHIYDGARYLFSAPIRRRTGFRNQEAAKQHQRDRAAAVKAKKKEAAANMKFIRSHPLNHLLNGLPDLAAQKPLPKAEVAQIVPVTIDSPAARPRPQGEQTSDNVIPIRPDVAETAETPPRREFTPEQDREILQRIIEGMRAERALRK